MQLDLVGPSNTLASPFADCEESINLFIERTAPGTGKTPAYLRKKPNVAPFATGLGDGPIRGQGLSVFTTVSRAFVVPGSHYVELDSAGLLADYGAVIDDGLPTSQVTNGTAGNQNLITSGLFGYVFDLGTNTLSGALGGGFPADAGSCEFMDGYGIVRVHNTRRFAISALEDFTTWDPLDVAERSEAPDNINVLIRSHREIWLLGNQTSEVWYDNGDPDFPFAPIQGVFLEVGCVGEWAACRADNTIFFLGRDERGDGIVYKMDGYTPVRVSTAAVENSIARSDVADSAERQRLRELIGFAEMCAFSVAGHLFIVLTIPELAPCWVYQVDENRWFRWGQWNSTTCVYDRLAWTSHLFQFTLHLVGDWQTGTVYDLSLNYQTDEVVNP